MYVVPTLPPFRDPIKLTYHQNPANLSTSQMPPTPVTPAAQQYRDDPSSSRGKDGADPTLKFTDVMNDLQRVYPKQVMDDISTSYCFICLLHLANEKGLVIDKTEGLDELYIKKDWAAVEGEED